MSDLHIYDKAKYHYDGDFPTGLKPSQGSVHIGVFLGWLCDRDLISDEFSEDFATEIAQFKARQLTGPQLLRRADETLASDMLTDEGNAFASAYYESDEDGYTDDYIDCLSFALPSVYHVQDTWQNYVKIKIILDQRFEQWKQTT